MLTASLNIVRPGGLNSFRNNRFLYAPYVVAAALLFTAVSKLAYFYVLDVSYNNTDPLLSFLTQREFLFVAAIYNIVIEIAIYRYKHTIAEGLIVLYFSVCATSYHVGISALGAPTCSCLGVANVWLISGVIDGIVMVLLALFWIYGIALVRTHYRVRRDNLSAATALVIGLSTLSIAHVSANESPLSIKATLASERLTRNGTYTQRIDTIHASFDSRAMLITTVYDRPDPNSEGGPCTNYVYLTKDVFAGFFRCKDLDTSVAGIADAKYAWALGNCKSITDTFTFLAVRSSELFPNARGGTRPRLSLTVHPFGSPGSVISEGRYTYSHNNSGLVLKCDIVVSRELKAGWLKSDLLPLKEYSEKELRQNNSLVNYYADNGIYETLTFMSYTNINGMSFPLRIESVMHNNGQLIDGITNNISGTTVFSINEVSIAERGSVNILPFTDDHLSVSEGRLQNRSLKIDGTRYVTNQLTSFEIPSIAVSSYNEDVKKAEQRSKQRRINNMYQVVTILLLVLGSIIVYLLYQMTIDKHEV